MTPEEEINSYRDLKPEWDGPGSIPPKNETIDSAIDFYYRYEMYCFDFEPTVDSDGNVGWHYSDEDVYLHICFMNEDKYVYYGRNKYTVIKGSHYAYDETIQMDLKKFMWGSIK